MMIPCISELFLEIQYKRCPEGEEVLFRYIRSLDISLLKTTHFDDDVVQNRNGGTEYGVYASHSAEFLRVVFGVLGWLVTVWTFLLC